MKQLIGFLFIVLLLSGQVYASDLQQEVKKVIEDGSTKTVQIIESEGSGSGFIISKDGYILTNAHVVHDNKTVIAIMSDGRKFKAEVISKSKVRDLALIKIKADNLLFFELSNSDEVYNGEFAIAIGYPFGEYSATFGIISSILEPNKDRAFFLKSDVAINPGNSGGPLIDLTGKIIGINDAIYEGANTTSYSIPSNTIIDSLPHLIAKEEIKQGFAGLTVQTLTPDLALHFNVLDTQSGVLIADIREGSNASKSGLEIGDIIISLNKRVVNDSARLSAMIANISPGNKADLSILRDGNLMNISFNVQEAPKKEEEETNE